MAGRIGELADRRRAAPGPRRDPGSHPPGWTERGYRHAGDRQRPAHAAPPLTLAVQVASAPPTRRFRGPITAAPGLFSESSPISRISWFAVSLDRISSARRLKLQDFRALLHAC